MTGWEMFAPGLALLVLGVVALWAARRPPARPCRCGAPVINGECQQRIADEA